MALLNDRLALRHARVARGESVAPPAINLATALSVVQVIELFCEIVAQQTRGARGKWRMVTLIEALKALLRLAMLARGRGRMLAQQRVPPRTTFALDTTRVQARLAALAVALGDPAPPVAETAPRPTLSAALAARHPPSRPAPLPPRRLVAELLWIAHPLLGLAALRRWGVRSWLAWALPLLVDAASRVLHESDALPPVEAAELRRRTLLMALALMRHPMYEHTARFVSQLPVGPLRRIGFLRSIAGALGDYFATYPDRYFYTH